MTSRSCQYISCHWDACSNHLAISDLMFSDRVNSSVQQKSMCQNKVIHSHPLVTITWWPSHPTMHTTHIILFIWQLHIKLAGEMYCASHKCTNNSWTRGSSMARDRWLQFSFIWLHSLAESKICKASFTYTLNSVAKCSGYLRSF